MLQTLYLSLCMRLAAVRGEEEVVDLSASPIFYPGEQRGHLVTLVFRVTLPDNYCLTWGCQAERRTQVCSSAGNKLKAGNGQEGLAANQSGFYLPHCL